MQNKDKILRVRLLVGLILLITAVGKVQAQEPVVQAVLFFSPYCSHCQTVRETALRELNDTFGDQFQLLEIDTSTDEGDLYGSAIEAFQIPGERQGIPTIIIGEDIFVGSYEIPKRLPDAVQAGLDAGGVDWPAIPGLARYLPTIAPLATQPSPILATPEETIQPDPSPTTKPEMSAVKPSLPPPAIGTGSTSDTVVDIMVARFNQDRLGNSISTVLLVVMMIILGEGGVRAVNSKMQANSWPGWIIPTLSFLGVAIASYLSFVEVTNTKAVCGPVGDCNAVQQSPYARLFGVLPVGIFGIFGYLIIFAFWMMQSLSVDKWRSFGEIALWLCTFFGVVFSIYLTFLEPFVLGATCAWCLSSAVIITIQYLAAVNILQSS